MFNRPKNPLFNLVQNALCSPKAKMYALMLLTLPSLVACGSKGIHQDRTVLTNEYAGTEYKIYPKSYSNKFTVIGTNKAKKYKGKKFTHKVIFLTDQVKNKGDNIPGSIEADVIINNGLGTLTAQFSIDQKTDDKNLYNINVMGPGVAFYNVKIKNGKVIANVSLGGNSHYSPRNNKFQLIEALRVPDELIDNAMDMVTKSIKSYDYQEKGTSGQNGKFGYKISVNLTTPGEAPSYGMKATFDHPAFREGSFENNILIHNGVHNWKALFLLTKNNLKITGINVDELSLKKQKALDDKLNNLAKAIIFFQISEVQKATGGNADIRSGARIYDGNFLGSYKDAPRNPKAHLISTLNSFPDRSLATRVHGIKSYSAAKDGDYRKGEGSFRPVGAVGRALDGILQLLPRPF